MNEYVSLAIGMLAAGLGGELFVRGAIGLASWARVPAGIVGATVAAFATSSPEFAVSVSAALAGKPQIAFGDALGSNVVNVGLILGAALLLSGIQAPREQIKRDFSVALLTPCLTGVLALDGVLSRADAALMIAIFLAWLVVIVRDVRRQRSAADGERGERRGGRALASGVVGLGLLIAAGQLIVGGAKEIALSFGMDEFVVGATIVAAGTSAPELATALASKLRGHDEIGLGTILGSNIFNGFWIVSVAALIAPIEVGWQEAAIGLAFGALLVAFTFPPRDGLLRRGRGAWLLTLYLAYLAIILQR